MDEHYSRRPDRLRRRILVGLGSTLAAPAIVRAQTSSDPLRIGWTSPDAKALLFLEDVFKARMAELGYIEGQNLVYEIVRIPNYAPSRVRKGYQEVLSRGVDIVVAWGPSSAIPAAHAAVDGKLPIVIASPDLDPVANGFAKSYRRPGGNLTGYYSVQVELTAKRFQLMKDAFPGIERLTVFWDELSIEQWNLAPAAAKQVGLELHGIRFGRRPYDYEAEFRTVPDEFRRAVVVLASPAFALPERNLLPDFALKQMLPTMFALRPYVLAGGLMSYGASFSAIWRGAADYVDRIAKGASPADLPIVRPTEFEFVVNLRTAKALGITLPEIIMLRTTEVIS